MYIEHQIIYIKEEIFRDGYIIPTNTPGTIIYIYPEQKAFEVEFTFLDNAVVVTIYDYEIQESPTKGRA